MATVQFEVLEGLKVLVPGRGMRLPDETDLLKGLKASLSESGVMSFLAKLVLVALAFHPLGELCRRKEVRGERSACSQSKYRFASKDISPLCLPHWSVEYSSDHAFHERRPILGTDHSTARLESADVQDLRARVV
jgi:hypothetical protein